MCSMLDIEVLNRKRGRRIWELIYMFLPTSDVFSRVITVVFIEGIVMLEGRTS